MTTRLYIEGQQIDLSDNIKIPLNYSIQDIKDISKTSSSFSKTINVPGTSNNNKAFNFLFDVKVVGNTSTDNIANIGKYYDFKKKARCYVIENNMVVMSGYAKLLSAINVNGSINYSIQITSELTDLISILADKRLEDISSDLTEQYTHQCDFDTIFDSWTSQDENPSTGIIYPLADYGQFDTVNASNFYLSNLRPALFAKQYIDLIFADAGFTYDSDFLNSEFFKRLVIPYKDGAFEGKGYESIVNAGDCDADYQFISVADDENYASAAEGQELFSCIQNGADYYSASGMTYTAPMSTVYDVEVKIPSAFYRLTNQFYQSSIFNCDFRLFVVYSVYTPDYSSSSIVTSWSKTYLKRTLQFGNPIAATGETYISETTPEEIAVPLQSIPLQEGEHLKVTIYLAYFNNINPTVTGTVGFYSSIGVPPQLKIGISKNFDNARISYSDFCLKDVKQVDFLSSVFKLFNLVPIPDKNKPKHFNILSADQYYKNDLAPLDWTDKVDYSQEVSITPIPSLSDGTLKLSYREDSDYWSAAYKTLTGKTYGEYTQETGYEFSSSTKDVLANNIFSATPAIIYRNEPIPCETTCEILSSDKSRIAISGYNEIQGQTLPSDKPFTHARAGVKIFYMGNIYTISLVENPLCFYVSTNVTRTGGAVDGTYYAKADTFYYLTENNKQLIALYESTDNNVTRKPKKVNPRIVYYQGIQSCNPYRLQLTPLLVDRSYNYVGSWFTTGKSEYPVFSHIDSNTNPTRDLLFKRPSPYYGSIKDYPDSNSEHFSNLLKNWENSFVEIVDNEAKMLTAWVKLNAVDIATLDLTRRILINGTYYRINSIKDYLPGTDGITQVEFVRCPTLQRYPVPLPPYEAPCKTYDVTNDSMLNVFVQYYDCNNSLTAKSILSKETITICAIEGTIKSPYYVTTTDKGLCGYSFTDFKVNNDTASGNSIIDITGIPGWSYTTSVLSGENKTYDREQVSGTTAISVTTTGSGTRSLQLLINDSVVSCIKVQNEIGSATYSLGTHTIGATDVVEIRFNNSNVCPVPVTITNESGSGYTVTGIANLPGFTLSGSITNGNTSNQARMRTSGTGSVAVTLSGSGTKSIQLFVDSVYIECATITGAGTYSFTSRSYSTDNLVQIIVNNTDKCTPPSDGTVVIENNHSNSSYIITSVSNIAGFSPSGGFPIPTSSSRTGTHNSNITGTIIVNLASGSSGKGRLYIDGTLFTTVNASGDKLTFSLILTTIYQDENILITYSAT